MTETGLPGEASQDIPTRCQRNVQEDQTKEIYDVIFLDHHRDAGQDNDKKDDGDDL
jgi:superfamily I DNA and RNA helicase